MSEDRDDQEILERLRRLAPSLPEEQRFWDDFAREVRLAYDGARSRRRAFWRRLVPAAAAVAMAATATVLVLWPSRPAPAPSLVAVPVPPAAAATPRPLPPPDDVEELDDAQLAAVLAGLAATDDGDEADEAGDPRELVEALSDDELRDVFTNLEGA